MKKYEATGDGKTVWVNGADGSCIARFGRNGIDIHRSATEQMAGGVECLECTHEPVTSEDWVSFKAGVEKHFGIKVPDRLKPTYLN